jgi:hypothetical protein
MSFPETTAARAFARLRKRAHPSVVSDMIMEDYATIQADLDEMRQKLDSFQHLV